MSNKYFSRLHFSIRSNVKVGMISDQAFRMYINLLTLNGDGSIEKDPPDEWIARQCGVAASDAVKIKAQLAKADLLIDGSWAVKNYANRQYKNPAQARYDNKKADKKSYGVSCPVLLDVEVEVEVDAEEEESKRKKGESEAPRWFASELQMRTMGDMATERGLKLSEVMESMNIPRITTAKVTEVMAHIKASGKVDPAKAATDASNAKLAKLKARVEELRTTPKLARLFIDDQNPQYQNALRVCLNELEATP